MTPCQQAIANMRALLVGVHFAGLLLEIGEALLGEEWTLLIAILDGALVSFELSTQQRAAIQSVIACVNSLITNGGTTKMASVSAVPPIPSVTEAAGLGVCATKSGNRGICCAAVTQLGLARAAQGFQYVNCNGKTVCLACGTKASVSKKNPGVTVFSVKRVSCGPSGCPALGGVQTITPPI